MKIDVTVKFVTDPALLASVDRLERMVHALAMNLDSLSRGQRFVLTKLEEIMATLEDVLADVADESTKEDSLIALTNGLKAQLDAALAGSLTPAQQAKVDGIFAAIEANKAKVQASIDANTSPPATPAVPPAEPSNPPADTPPAAPTA